MRHRVATPTSGTQQSSEDVESRVGLAPDLSLNPARLDWWDTGLGAVSIHRQGNLTGDVVCLGPPSSRSTALVRLPKTQRTFYLPLLRVSCKNV